MFIHPIIFCVTSLNNMSEGDTYLYSSATSPDCHQGSERTTEMRTGESGADEANRTVNSTAYESNSAPRHVIYQSI